MAKRKSISKKTRFEVFKRDSFTCQYCGRSAPDVLLQIDHIEPYSKTEDNDILNLVTSCSDCNLGKGAKSLQDDTVIKKKKQQLNELQERREQLEMMMAWHRSLLDLEEQAVTELSDFWSELTEYNLNEYGLKNIKRWVKRFGLQEVIEVMKISTSQYLKYEYTEENPTSPTHESVEKSFNYIPKICASRRKTKDKPYLKDLYYIRGIIRNRLSYINEWQSIQIMEEAFLVGVSIDTLKNIALAVDSWKEFKVTVDYCKDYKERESGENGQETL